MKLKDAKQADDTRKRYGKFEWNRNIYGGMMILDYGF
jgi:hypothetical protein